MLAVSSLLTDIGPQAVGASLLKSAFPPPLTDIGPRAVGASLQKVSETAIPGAEGAMLLAKKIPKMMRKEKLLPVMAKAGGAEAYAPISYLRALNGTPYSLA
eukprot:gene21935-28981_t